jgi:S-adenosylmethionine hydrolase
LKIPNNAGSSVKIELFDSQGKSLLKQVYPSTKLIDFEEEIQTQNLQSGVYLLTIETTQGKETKRVMIR